jgi:DNA-binding NarL/FixJ family response regulator
VHHAADALTEREVKVLRQVAAGNPNKIVAAQLSITEETVKASDVRIQDEQKLPTVGRSTSNYQ